MGPWKTLCKAALVNTDIGSMNSEAFTRKCLLKLESL